MIAYWEGDRAFLFHAGWGVDPPVLSVPSERAWDAVVPAWLLGRRDEVVERLRLQSGHVLEETDVGYAAGKGELRPVGSKDDAYAIAAAFLDSIPGIVGPWEPGRSVRSTTGGGSTTGIWSPSGTRRRFATAAPPSSSGGTRAS